MSNASKQKKIWLVPVLLLLVLVGGWWSYRASFPPYTPPALPVPNGYDDLLQAAAMLAPRTGFYDEMGDAELASVVEQNQPALEIVRAALQKQCVVALDWSADRAWLENAHMDNVGSMKALARAFAASARYAKKSKQIDKAVHCGLDCIELAQASSQGGLIIDQSMAGGVHYTAMYILRDLVDQLSQNDSLRLLNKLQASPLRMEPSEKVFEREAAFFREINGEFQTFMMRKVIETQRQESLQQLEKSDRQHAVMETLLQTHLALHAFRLDNNRLPTTLEELVPIYLRTIPLDEFSSGSLLYRPSGDGYQLYSVGLDGLDDHGVETQDGVTGDLTLDTNE